MDEPLIVTPIDGVGTKTKFILEHLGIENGLKSLAKDIVNHCINDILNGQYFIYNRLYINK